MYSDILFALLEVGFCYISIIRLFAVHQCWFVIVF